MPVPSQLRSHRLFAENFETFANAVDSATLYHTGETQTCMQHKLVLYSITDLKLQLTCEGLSKKVLFCCLALDKKSLLYAKGCYTACCKQASKP